MNLAAPTLGEIGELVPPGRLYLATEPTLVRLKDRADGFDVQFVLMPYPTPTRYLRDEAAQKYASPEEKNQRLMTAFREALRTIRQHARFDPTRPDRARRPRQRPGGHGRAVAVPDRRGRRRGVRRRGRARRVRLRRPGPHPQAAVPSAAGSTSATPGASSAWTSARPTTRRASSSSTSGPRDSSARRGCCRWKHAHLRDRRPQPGGRPAGAAGPLPGRPGRPGEPAHHLHGRDGQPGGGAAGGGGDLPAVLHPRLDRIDGPGAGAHARRRADVPGRGSRRRSGSTSGTS